MSSSKRKSEDVVRVPRNGIWRTAEHERLARCAWACPAYLPVAPMTRGLRLTVVDGLPAELHHPALLPSLIARNYFYIQTPSKNYQIKRQYDQAFHGKMVTWRFEFQRRPFPASAITRAHLEEDVGKNFHFDRKQRGWISTAPACPLLEIVSEPDNHQPGHGL